MSPISLNFVFFVFVENLADHTVMAKFKTKTVPHSEIEASEDQGDLDKLRRDTGYVCHFLKNTFKFRMLPVN